MAVSSTPGQENGKNNSLDGRDKLSGRIVFKCNYFAELARFDNFRKFSEEKLCIRGLSWRLIVKERPNYLGIYVQCEKENNGAWFDNDWSCHANVGICLHSQKRNVNIDKSFDHNFHVNKSEEGFDEFMEIGAILDPKNRWLDKDGALHISADVELLGKPQGVPYITRPHVLLVNGKEVEVNKHHLACQTDYFERFFFGEEYKKASTELLIGPPATATVDHFERMLDTMEPQNRPLDDQCIEGVLHLANQFFLADVEGKCRNFLSIRSNHSAIFKYRLADKYHFDLLKEQILSSNMEKFSKQADFFENLREYHKLDEPARKTLDIRLVQLFGNNFFAKESSEASIDEAGTDLNWLQMVLEK